MCQQQILKFINISQLDYESEKKEEKMTSAGLNLFRQALMEKHLNISSSHALSVAMILSYYLYG